MTAKTSQSTSTLGQTPLSNKALSPNTTYTITVALAGWEVKSIAGDLSEFYTGGQSVTFDTSKPTGVPKNYCFYVSATMRKLATGTSFTLEGTEAALSYGLRWQSVAGAKTYKIYKDNVKIIEVSQSPYSTQSSPGTFKFFVEAYDGDNKLATSNTISLVVTESGKDITGTDVGGGDGCGCNSAYGIIGNVVKAVNDPVGYALCRLSCYILGVISYFVQLALVFLQKASGL